jgi:hypothetical protein
LHRIGLFHPLTGYLADLWRRPIPGGKALCLFAWLFLCLCVACHFCYPDTFPFTALSKTLLVGLSSALAYLGVSQLTRSWIPGGFLCPVLVALVPLGTWLSWLFWGLALLGTSFLPAFLSRLTFRPHKNSRWIALFLATCLVLLAGLILPRYTGPWIGAAPPATPVPKDTAFHSSIAAMYKNYSVASVGLDGLMPIRYYTFSHEVYAGVSVLSGLSAFEVYTCFHFVLAPVGFILLGSLLARSMYRVPLLTACIILTVLLLACSVRPEFRTFIKRVSGHRGQYLISESYFFGLCFLFAFLACLKLSLDTERPWPVLWLSMIYLYFATASKASVGACGFPVLVYTWIRYYRRSWVLPISLFVLTASLYLFLFAPMRGTASRALTFQFLAYVKEYCRVHASVLTKVFVFVAAHYSATFLLISLGFLQQRTRYLRSFEFGMVLTFLLPATIAWMFAGSAAGGVYYFTSIPQLLAASLLAGRLPHALAWTWPRLRRLKLPAATAAFLILLVASRPLWIRKPPNIADSRRRRIAKLSRMLIHIRRTSPLSTRIAVENPEDLVELMGLTGYFYVPALAERPLAGGLLDVGEFPKKGYYGMAAYRGRPEDLVQPTMTLRVPTEGSQGQEP